ncbi:hypothetical protein JXD38_01520, partial [candidate division WOR-3 bacterium]|nr:hypothetical protein [candidate division WOR-3 bacterium]
RFNYLRQIKIACDFVASYQVSDSLSPSFGGIIEAEHMPTVIETDNTQEAVWIWSRWYELTGRDDYHENIRRAWIYVLNNPAFREHGGAPSQVWYAIWNCGLGFMAEAEYRHAYGDSTYLAYADTCRSFYLENPLGNSSSLDYFVTSQSSGMAMDYARARSDAVLHDTALARGQRVKTWVEGAAATRLGTQNWAMCGGTAFWGIVHTVGKEDTAAGKVWLETYAESLPGFYPSGTWNCSHNIWLGNAYRSAAELGHDTLNWVMHHYLVDTLLMLDTDDDGGIPATWTDPNTQDQTWVSTYLDFMGMDVFVTPTYDTDVATLEFVAPDPHGVYIVGDSIDVSVPIANVGRNTLSDFELTIDAGGMGTGVHIDSLPFLATETIAAGPVYLDTPGLYNILAYTDGDDNPLNDTVRLNLKVYDTCTLAGTLIDSTSSEGIPAWVKARLGQDTLVWDSAYTDRSGNFDLRLIDSIFSLSIEPSVPYYARSWDLTLYGDTTVSLLTQPAHVLVVNNDTLERYADYYTSTLDTLGVTWCQWNRPSSGLLPYPQVARLRANTLIWYSGNTNSGTVPAADRDSLTRYAQNGTNLFITGQNIAEELHDSPFLESICGCRFDSSGWSGFFAFGDRQDSLGAPVTGTATTGGNGASNQTSRDVISPLGNSSGFLIYDSVNVTYAATRRQIPSGGKVVFMGLGFEAVNRPGAKPTYFNRMQLMGLILNWFGVPTGVKEQPQATNRKQQAFATIVRGMLVLPGLGTRSELSDNPVMSRTALLDASGRRVMQLRPGANDLSRLPAGVYFVRPDGTARSRETYRVLLVR